MRGRSLLCFEVWPIRQIPAQSENRAPKFAEIWQQEVDQVRSLLPKTGNRFVPRGTGAALGFLASLQDIRRRERWSPLYPSPSGTFPLCKAFVAGPESRSDGEIWRT